MQSLASRVVRNSSRALEAIAHHAGSVRIALNTMAESVLLGPEASTVRKEKPYKYYPLVIFLFFILREIDCIKALRTYILYPFVFSIFLLLLGTR